MRRQGYAAFISLVIGGLMISAMVNTAAASITPNATSDLKTKVLVFIQSGNAAVKARIELDDRLDITYEQDGGIAQINNLNNFDVFFVCGYLPESTTYIGYLNSNVTAGKGLFVWGGYYPIFAETGVAEYSTFKNLLPVRFKDPFTIEEELYLDQDWVGQIELKVNADFSWSDGTSATSPKLLQRSVVWESSPLVKERIYVNSVATGGSVLVYRPTQNEGPVVTSGGARGEPLVAYITRGTGRVLWTSMVVGSITAYFSEWITQGGGPYWQRVRVPGTSELRNLDGNDANKPFYLWPYFNYFVFQSARFLSAKFTAASEIDTYAEWPHSPIPHETEATLWMIFVAGLWVFNFVLFFTLGKKKKAAGREGPSPEATDAVKKEEAPAVEEKKYEGEKTEGKDLITEEKKPGEGETQ